MKKRKYIVTYHDDELCFYIIRKESNNVFLLEDLSSELTMIYATGLLRTFDEEEVEGKYLYEFTKEELGEECSFFFYQEAALGYIARLLECEEKHREVQT